MSIRSSSFLGAVFVVLSIGTVACAGGGTDDVEPSTGGASSDVVSSKTPTVDGLVEAGGPTGYQLTQKLGPVNEKVHALYLDDARLPGPRLVGKTLRVTGRIEKRALGKNGQDLQEVLVVTDAIERTDKKLKVTGILETRPTGPVIVERTPKDAPPQDQSLVETPVELSQLQEPAPYGAEVTLRGKVGNRFLSSPNGDLVSREVLFAEAVEH